MKRFLLAMVKNINVTKCGQNRPHFPADINAGIGELAVLHPM